MRKTSILVTALSMAIGASGPAHAALIPTLATIAPAPNGSSYFYDVLLTGDEGLSTSVINPLSGLQYGSELVIYDFNEYVAGSIFTSNANFSTSVQLLSPLVLSPPGYTDNPSLYNLVFTYTGPDIHTSGGPYSPIDLGTFGAVSTLSGSVIGAFGSIAVKNTGPAYPAGTANTAAFNQGSVSIPAAIPEASTWAMTIIGFGVIGSTLRRRRTLGRRSVTKASVIGRSSSPLRLGFS